MKSARATTSPREQLLLKIEQLRNEADEAKKQLDYEFSFVLYDQADVLEKQLEDALEVYKT